MVHFTHLLFDADDTLFDFHTNERTAFSLLCRCYQLPYTEDVFHTYSAINQSLWQELEQGKISKNALVVERFRRFLSTLGSAEDPAAVNASFLSYLAQATALMPHAVEVCRALSAHYPLIIVTNAVAAVHKSRLEKSALAPYISRSFVSETVGCEKPSAAYFDYVMAHLPGVSREECLLIGDSPSSDLRGAFNAGIPACWYAARGGSLPPDLSVLWQITDLAELPSLLQSYDRT